MVSNNWTSNMYGIDPTNPSDLLVEYLIKSNEVGVKALLMSYGIMADTQAKQIMGLHQLILSKDENTIYKIIALDPNIEIHEEYFKNKYKIDELNEKIKNKESIVAKDISSKNHEPVTNPVNKFFGGSNISIMELLLFLLCAYILVQIIKN